MYIESNTTAVVSKIPWDACVSAMIPETTNTVCIHSIDNDTHCCETCMGLMMRWYILTYALHRRTYVHAEAGYPTKYAQLTSLVVTEVKYILRLTCNEC